MCRNTIGWLSILWIQLSHYFYAIKCFTPVLRFWKYIHTHVWSLNFVLFFSSRIVVIKINIEKLLKLIVINIKILKLKMDWSDQASLEMDNLLIYFNCLLYNCSLNLEINSSKSLVNGKNCTKTFNKHCNLLSQWL